MSVEQETGSVLQRYLNKAAKFYETTGKEANVIYVGHSDWAKMRMLSTYHATVKMEPTPSGGWRVDGKVIVGVMRDNWLEVGYVE
jgi:hypothetical protein